MCNEISKHLKKRASNTSKSKSRSNHKHIYKPCLIKYNNLSIIKVRKYCTICGKLQHTNDFFETEKEGAFYRILTNEEILAKYPDLEIFHLDNLSIDKINIK